MSSLTTNFAVEKVYKTLICNIGFPVVEMDGSCRDLPSDCMCNSCTIMNFHTERRHLKYTKMKYLRKQHIPKFVEWHVIFPVLLLYFESFITHTAEKRWWYVSCHLPEY
jgi:bacteriorhodopsin